MTLLAWILAQADPNAAPPATPQTSGWEAFFANPMFPLILVIAVFWFIMSRGRSKERQKYEEMLNSLKKNDRVQTIGGIIGTVVEVRDGEVVLKVDESNNTKMRFNRSAIKDVIREGTNQ
jgi:preprotein translocase subunit YajC